MPSMQLRPRSGWRPSTMPADPRARLVVVEQFVRASHAFARPAA